MIDLRVSAGFFFLLLGVILCATGLLFPQWRAPLTEANVNLGSGIMMLAFGGLLLWFSTKKLS